MMRIYRVTTPSPMLQARRLPLVPRCNSFKNYFSRLPTEIQLLIIELALLHELNKPKTISICAAHTSTQIRTAPFPPLFHVNKLFRLEATRLSITHNSLVPLLAAHRSKHIDLTGYTHLRCLVIARAAAHMYALIATYISKFRASQKYHGNHLFDPETQLFELDISHRELWHNAFLRLSPALLNHIRYLQLIVKIDVKRPQMPIWNYVGKTKALNQLPIMMPNLELVIVKRADFCWLRVDREMYGMKQWLVGKKWEDLRVHFMVVRSGQILKKKRYSDKAMVEYWPKWKAWVGEECEEKSRQVEVKRARTW